MSAGRPEAMRGKRYHRRVADVLHQHGFVIHKATATGKTHIRVDLERGGNRGTIICSSSPRDEAAAVNLTLQEARRATRDNPLKAGTR